MLRAIVIAAASCLATLLGLELVMRCLPVSSATLTGYYADPDILGYPTGHEWTVATGWDLRNAQHLRANNLGFSADADFVPDPQALVLIGDSYVEASALAAPDRPDVQLAAALAKRSGSRPVYAMGSPGTALLDYAQRIRFAAERLQSRDFVVWLEQGDAREAVCGSGQVHSRCLDRATLAPRIERLPGPSALKRWARHSALAQYVFGQLKLDPARLWAAVLPARAAAPQPSAAEVAAARAASMKMVEAVLDEFTAQAGPHLRGRLLFAVDGHRGPPPAQPSAIDFERNYLLRRLAERGFEVIDLEPVYAAWRAQSKLSPEIGPYDQHLNALGVRLVMGAIAARLQQ